MARVEVKDVSRTFRTYGADGGGEDHTIEEYVVLCNGFEVYRNMSRTRAERAAARFANIQARRRVA
jgi:hypothetical protein